MIPKLLFVIADGGRARLLTRARTGEFVPLEEMDNAERLDELRDELRTSPLPRVIGQGERRHAVEHGDRVRLAKEAFMARVARRVVEVARRSGMEGVVLAAPRRLVAPLRARLGQDVAVARVVSKDLTKVPDHELGAWLGGLLPASGLANGAR